MSMLACPLHMTFMLSNRWNQVCSLGILKKFPVFSDISDDEDCIICNSYDVMSNDSECEADSVSVTDGIARKLTAWYPQYPCHCQSWLCYLQS
jgi:hypothetical protein